MPWNRPGGSGATVTRRRRRSGRRTHGCSGGRFGGKTNVVGSHFHFNSCFFFSRRAGTTRIENEGRKRSEEHTSELQSRQYLVCRLLLEKKKKRQTVARLACQNVGTDLM